jgi:transcriptional regulator with XRE-family HTH domain
MHALLLAKSSTMSNQNQLAKYLAQTTQAEFARKVQCSDSHLSLILNGERGMSLALAKRISAASGVPIENLPQAVRAPARAPDRAVARKR